MLSGVLSVLRPALFWWSLWHWGGVLERCGWLFEWWGKGKRWDLLFVAGPLGAVGVTEGESAADVNAKAFRRLSLIARAGFRPIAPKFSKVGVAARGLAPLRLATVGVSGLSPCNILTLTMSISSLARVFERSSMSCCASAHFSVASSWISAYEADIFTGMDDFGEGTGEDGEVGLVETEDAWREWLMYLAESLSISCWSSDPYNSRRSFKRNQEGVDQLTNCSTFSMPYLL